MKLSIIVFFIIFYQLPCTSQDTISKDDYNWINENYKQIRDCSFELEVTELKYPKGGKYFKKDKTPNDSRFFTTNQISITNQQDYFIDSLKMDKGPYAENERFNKRFWLTNISSSKLIFPKTPIPEFRKKQSYTYTSQIQFLVDDEWQFLSYIRISNQIKKIKLNKSSTLIFKLHGPFSSEGELRDCRIVFFDDDTEIISNAFEIYLTDEQVDVIQKFNSILLN